MTPGFSTTDELPTVASGYARKIGRTYWIKTQLSGSLVSHESNDVVERRQIQISLCAIAVCWWQVIDLGVVASNVNVGNHGPRPYPHRGKEPCRPRWTETVQIHLAALPWEDDRQASAINCQSSPSPSTYIFLPRRLPWDSRSICLSQRWTKTSRVPSALMSLRLLIC